MKVFVKAITIPRSKKSSLLSNIKEHCLAACSENEIPLRFIVTKSDEQFFHCEVDLLETDTPDYFEDKSIFNFKPRPFEDQSQFNAVLVTPTGIAAELGGHAGDSNALARFMGSACDTLITHPNVVNASDINEMPENCLYVEGSVISRLLMGTVALKPTRANRLLLVMDDHADSLVKAQVINAASAARCTLGADVQVVALQDKPVLSATVAESGRAVGDIQNLVPLLSYLGNYRDEYDAVALATVVHFPKEIHEAYLDSAGGLVNPWGGVEAMLTHAVSHYFDIPSAHAPMMETRESTAELSEVIDPRMAAEELSSAFIHCVLKGLQRAPQIINDPALLSHPSLISAMNISCLVIPDKCVGLPTLAALEQGIPVIAVKENGNLMKNDLSQLNFKKGQLIVVDNYLEAVGVMQALKSGVSLESIRRPIGATQVKIH